MCPEGSDRGRNHRTVDCVAKARVHPITPVDVRFPGSVGAKVARRGNVESIEHGREIRGKDHLSLLHPHGPKAGASHHRVTRGAPIDDRVVRIETKGLPHILRHQRVVAGARSRLRPAERARPAQELIQDQTTRLGDRGDGPDQKAQQVVPNPEIAHPRCVRRLKSKTPVQHVVGLGRVRLPSGNGAVKIVSERRCRLHGLRVKLRVGIEIAEEIKEQGGGPLLHRLGRWSAGAEVGVGHIPGDLKRQPGRQVEPAAAASDQSVRQRRRSGQDDAGYVVPGAFIGGAIAYALAWLVMPATPQPAAAAPAAPTPPVPPTPPTPPPETTESA